MDVTPQRKTRAQEEAISRERPARRMQAPQGAFHVIHGEEPSQPLKPENELAPSVIRTKFKKFVKEFMYQVPKQGEITSTLKYRDQLQQNCAAKFFKLTLNVHDLEVSTGDGEVLAHCLKQKPTETIPICEQALKDLYTEMVKPLDREGTLPTESPAIQLQLCYDIDLEGTRASMKPLMIRELTSDQVEKLVVVQGIVISARSARHKARKVVLKCSNCENVKEIKVGPGWCAAHVPSSCDGNALSSGIEKCPPNPFRVVDDLCDYVDEQVLRMQELPEHVPTGEMPRHVDLCAQQYLVDMVTPGARMTAIGVFCATEHSMGDKLAGNRQKGTNTVKYSYLQVLGIEVSQGAAGLGGLALSREEEEFFDQLAKEPDVREKIYQSIAPSIRASSLDVVDDVKKAVACLLFGGSRKQLADETRMRGDINVLLLGDPGTAKSQFLKFAEKAAPVAVYTSGKGSSAAGLTAAIRRDGNGFSLEGGAMVLADGGIVCIDEFDKMNVDDRVAIHEAMEQQTISIAKAGITTMLNTRCSVLAAANPRFGSYDPSMSMLDQMDFETTILSRFDMMFMVRDVHDGGRDFELAMHMVSLHRGEERELETPLNVVQLRKYISYCRNKCAPRLTPEAAEVLRNHYVTIRKEMKEKESGIPMTVRQLEAIVRISESLAKMQLTEDVDINHMEEALRLFTASTIDSANTDLALANKLSEEEREEVNKAEDHVRRRLQRGGRMAFYTLLNFLVADCGVEEKYAKRAIQSMHRVGELRERPNNTVERC
mmetsp:Transcript_36156/g.81836  ORF Transcript_36156/g.81836 Transcript_36156/m.81836 type:complete len:771 (+) Transcript_36156:68-2380(+)